MHNCAHMQVQQNALWQHLYQSAVAKLAVANPKVLARMQRRDAP